MIIEPYDSVVVFKALTVQNFTGNKPIRLTGIKKRGRGKNIDISCADRLIVAEMCY